MTEKNVHVERVARQRESERKRIKTTSLKNRAPREPERLRAAQAPRRSRGKRLEENNERMEKIKEMKRAIEDQRKHLLRREASARPMAVTDPTSARHHPRTGRVRDQVDAQPARRLDGPAGATEWDTIARHAAETPAPATTTRQVLAERPQRHDLGVHAMTDIDWRSRTPPRCPVRATTSPGPSARRSARASRVRSNTLWTSPRWAARRRRRGTLRVRWSGEAQKLRHIQKDSADREAVLFAANASGGGRGAATSTDQLQLTRGVGAADRARVRRRRPDAGRGPQNAPTGGSAHAPNGWMLRMFLARFTTARPPPPRGPRPPCLSPSPVARASAPAVLERPGGVLRPLGPRAAPVVLSSSCLALARAAAQTRCATAAASRAARRRAVVEIDALQHPPLRRQARRP